MSGSGVVTLCVLVAVLCGVKADCSKHIHAPVVCLSNRRCLEGVWTEGFQTDCFQSFLGIPYAKPPIGSLRFANPVPSEPWTGVLSATTPKQDCLQKNYLLPIPVTSGQEDCLYLNVYVPKKASKIILPVMVYIFGGGFFSGSANPYIHGPEYFMDTQQVILVTVAYRLGALGFLSTGDESCPGNFGFKDQNLALKWIQQHIKAFGGDPNRVTIFGQSAGGVSVHMHMLSPLSEGLFNQAIVMSGNAAAPYNKAPKDPLQQTKDQAKFCGIENANKMKSEQLIKALRKVNATTLVDSGDEFKYWHVDPLVTFRPAIEPDIEGAFMTRDPKEIIRTGEYRHVPWMTGFVPSEGAVRALSIISNETLKNDFNANFDDLLMRLMEFADEGTSASAWRLKQIVDFYLNGTHHLGQDNVQRFVDIISDRAFFHPLYKTLESYVGYADLERNPVYLYKFAFKGPYSYSFLYTGSAKDYGVVHCDDLIYLFKSPVLFSAGFNKTSVDAKVIQHMVGAFVTFASNGQPTNDGSLKSCNKGMFLKNQYFCDYMEYKNTEDNGFILQRNSHFPVDAVKFWDKLLV